MHSSRIDAKADEILGCIRDRPSLIPEESFNDLRAMWESAVLGAVWWGTPVECVSAVDRRNHGRSISQADSRRALAKLAELRSAWQQVEPSNHIRDEAAAALASAGAASGPRISSEWTLGSPRPHARAVVHVRLASRLTLATSHHLSLRYQLFHDKPCTHPRSNFAPRHHGEGYERARF